MLDFTFGFITYCSYVYLLKANKQKNSKGKKKSRMIKSFFAVLKMK